MSKRFQFNRQDGWNWAKNALIFAAPALLVLLGDLKQYLPEGTANGVIALYTLNVLTDFMKKLIAGKK